MNLNVQFEVVLASLSFGVLFMILYDLFNLLLYRKKGKFSRLILEIIFMGTMTLFFFYIMLKIANANLNIFIPLFIFLGIAIYFFFLRYSFLSYYQYLYSKINLYIKRKKLSIRAKFDIIKMKKRKARIKKHEKNLKSKESKVS